VVAPGRHTFRGYTISEKSNVTVLPHVLWQISFSYVFCLQRSYKHDSTTPSIKTGWFLWHCTSFLGSDLHLNYLRFLRTPFEMGNQISDLIKTVDRADEKERIAKEQLEMLMKLADARLDSFEEKLNRMFLDKDCALFIYYFVPPESDISLQQRPKWAFQGNEHCVLSVQSVSILVLRYGTTRELATADVLTISISGCTRGRWSCRCVLWSCEDWNGWCFRRV